VRRVRMCVPEVSSAHLKTLMRRHIQMFLPEVRGIRLYRGYTNGVPTRDEDQVEHSFENNHRYIRIQEPDA